MKTLATIVFTTLLAGAAVAASPPKQQIVVSSKADTRGAVASVSSELSSRLKQAETWPRTENLADGMAIVRFTRGSDGRATNIALYHREGGGQVGRIAMRAVSRLTRLERLPDGMGAGQVYQANIVLASDQQSYERISRKLDLFEARRIASSPNERKVLAIAASSTSLS